MKLVYNFSYELLIGSWVADTGIVKLSDISPEALSAAITAIAEKYKAEIPAQQNHAVLLQLEKITAIDILFDIIDPALNKSKLKLVSLDTASNPE